MIGRALLLAGAVAAVAYARPKLVERMHPKNVGPGSDVFALPPPALLEAMSLGYRSALADVLFTRTIVDNGIHAEEHRRFEHVGAYLEGISALDPFFCQTYRYTDTLIVYQPVGSPTPDDIRLARKILERGLEHCPFDGPLHMSAGQFMVFIAPQFLVDDAEKDAFRAAGANVLARGGELETVNSNVQWQAITAANVFARAGQRDAAINFLERVYAVTDDEELRKNIEGKLAVLRKEEVSARAEAQESAFRELWKADLPFASRTELLVVGPPPRPAACAGARDGRCATSWLAWAALRE
jgi:hypothetical protein